VNSPVSIDFYNNISTTFDCSSYADFHSAAYTGVGSLSDDLNSRIFGNLTGILSASIVDQQDQASRTSNM